MAATQETIMTFTTRHLLTTAAVLTVTVAAGGGAAALINQPEPDEPGVLEATTDATEDQDAAEAATPDPLEEPAEPAEDTTGEPADHAGGSAEEPADPVGEDTAEPAEDPASQPHATDLEGIDVQPEGQELLLRIDDAVLIVGLLDPEGESFYRHATIWPGSTRDEITIVAVSQAEGMYDLRWLTLTDGDEGAPVQAFPTHHQPDTEMVGAADVVPIPVFSPDGRSVAWLEWNTDGQVSLRTVGWDGGPGTGRTADDNATFALDELPAGVQLQRWVAATGDSSQLHVVDQEGTTWTITVQRQADGALALAPDAVQKG